MAHFAEVDATNTVVRVVVVHNDVTTVDGVEVEQRGIDFLDEILPVAGSWVQTSYNGTFRHNYAGAGFVWDATNDAFYVPQPYPSWTLDSTYSWQAPVDYPEDDGQIYTWDETTTSWVVA